MNRGVVVAAVCAWTATGCSAVTGFGDFTFAPSASDAGPTPVDGSRPGDGASEDAGADGSPTRDAAGEHDAGPPDAGGRDAGPLDAGPGDAGGRDSGPGDAGPGDAGPRDAGPPDAGPPECLVRTSDGTTFRELGRTTATASVPALVSYRVQYEVDGLAQLGQICRPAGDATGLPIIGYVHSGFDGMEAEWGLVGGLSPNLCHYVASHGAVFVEPQLRGQSDSQGRSGGDIEVCAGEVDDLLGLVAIATEGCGGDPATVALGGLDHGGCVALRAGGSWSGAAGPRALAVGGTPSDAQQLAFELSRASSPEARELYGTLVTAIGDPGDAANDAAYAERNVLGLATRLGASRVPVMITHDVGDRLISVSHACTLRDAVESGGVGFTSYHVGFLGNLVGDPLTDCPGDGATYLTDEWPTGDLRFVGDYYFIAFEGLGGYRAQSAVADYVLSHVSPGPTP